MHISDQTPPTFIAQTDDDRSFIMGTQTYFAALQAGKVPSEFAEYPKGGHGYGLRSKADVRAWPDRCVAWLHKVGIL